MGVIIPATAVYGEELKINQFDGQTKQEYIIAVENHHLQKVISLFTSALNIPWGKFNVHDRMPLVLYLEGMIAHDLTV